MATDREKAKRIIKGFIPWRIRYYIKLQEAMGKIKLSDEIKQFRGIEEYNRVFYKALQDLNVKDFNGKTVCEMGPGQHLSHAFLEYQMGAERELLLEIADFANVDSPAKLDYLKLDGQFDVLRELPALYVNETWNSYLKKINASYYITGLEGYKNIEDESVDYCFSFAVFEHIRKPIFIETIQELYRFMRKGGVCYNTVDFTDHMGGRKNQLRFSEAVWEDEEHHNMDNYTNRISCSQICEILKKTGFREVRVIRSSKFKELPIKRNAVSEDLGFISDEDLKIADATIVLKK